MTQRLARIMHALSAEPQSEHPVLSVYLDWSVDQSGKRQSLQLLDQELDRLSASFGERGPARTSFDADRERILRYVNQEAPADASGLAIFACDGRQIWTALPLMVPVATEIAADTYPHLYQLAHLIDEHETFAVVLAEGQQAQIYVMSLETMEQVGQTEAREKVNRTDVGGWSQLRYERHVGFTLQLHLNDLAMALQEAVDEYDVHHIVILTNDSIKGHVRQALPQQLSERVVEMGAYRRPEELPQVIAELEPLMQENERRQEAGLIGRLEEQLATKGGLAFSGEAAVMQAVHKGQVDTLILDETYEGGQGGECPSCGMLRAGQRQKCPYDGSELRPIDLREGLVLQGLRQGAQVEIVAETAALREMGGVAALLRYRDDVQQEVGDGIA